MLSNNLVFDTSVTYFSSMLPNLHIVLTESIFRDISRSTINHINIFVSHLLIQELFVNKIYFFNNAVMDQLKIITTICSSSLSVSFHVYLWSTRKEKYSVHVWIVTSLIKHTKISFSIAFLVFWRFSCVSWLKCSATRYLKAKVLQLPQKIMSREGSICICI